MKTTVRPRNCQSSRVAPCPARPYPSRGGISFSKPFVRMPLAGTRTCSQCNLALCRCLSARPPLSQLGQGCSIMQCPVAGTAAQAPIGTQSICRRPSSICEQIPSSVNRSCKTGGRRTRCMRHSPEKTAGSHSSCMMGLLMPTETCILDMH